MGESAVRLIGRIGPTGALILARGKVRKSGPVKFGRTAKHARHHNRGGFP